MSDSASHSLQENSKFIRATLIMGALAFAVAAVAYFVTIVRTGPIPRDMTTLVVGRDFLDFWINGRAAWGGDPGRLYDPQMLMQVITSLLGPNYPGQGSFYPPGMLLITAPFGLLAYMPALLVWTLAGISIFAWCAFRFLPDRNAALALILSPAAIFCLMSGQASFFFASLFLAIFSLLDRRPLFAGILIGLISLKPPLGVFFPLLLVAQSRWRTFGAAAITTLVICGISAVIWGPGTWLDYIHEGIPGGNLVLTDPTMIAAPFMSTVFMNMRLAGANYNVAMLAQGIAALLAAAALVWGCRSRPNADCVVLFALLAGCSIFAVPYLLSYDTLPLTAAAMMLLASGRLDGPGRRIVQLIYWLPLIQFALGSHHIPGAILITLAFTAYVFLRPLGALGENETATNEPTPVRKAGAPLNIVGQGQASHVA